MNDLKINCKDCLGFCCVALYFSKQDGFPEDKKAGVPCKQLQGDFGCAIHENLREKGLKGCTIYDCFGAGQKVAKIIYKGESWRKSQGLQKEMFDVFLVVRQLHEMLWYLTDAYKVSAKESDQVALKQMIESLENLTLSTPKVLLALNLEEYRKQVNALLKKAVKLKARPTGSLMGRKFKKEALKGVDLSGAMLIRTDLRACDLSGTVLIGADMRDTDLRGANLEKALFMTQAQVNGARGDASTKLPARMERPTYWED